MLPAYLRAGFRRSYGRYIYSLNARASRPWCSIRKIGIQGLSYEFALKPDIHIYPAREGDEESGNGAWCTLLVSTTGSREWTCPLCSDMDGQLHRVPEPVDERCRRMACEYGFHVVETSDSIEDSFEADQDHARTAADQTA
jgi:hypothetical protein